MTDHYSASLRERLDPGPADVVLTGQLAGGVIWTTTLLSLKRTFYLPVDQVLSAVLVSCVPGCKTHGFVDRPFAAPAWQKPRFVQLLDEVSPSTSTSSNLERPIASAISVNIPVTGSRSRMIFSQSASRRDIGGAINIQTETRAPPPSPSIHCDLEDSTTGSEVIYETAAHPPPYLRRRTCNLDAWPHVCGVHHDPRYRAGPESPRTSTYVEQYLSGVIPPPSLPRLRPNAPEFVPNPANREMLSSTRPAHEGPLVAGTSYGSSESLGFTLGVPDYTLWSEPTYPDFGYIADCWMTTSLLDC